MPLHTPRGSRSAPLNARRRSAFQSDHLFLDLPPPGIGDAMRSALLRPHARRDLEAHAAFRGGVNNPRSRRSAARGETEVVVPATQPAGFDRLSRMGKTVDPGITARVRHDARSICECYRRAQGQEATMDRDILREIIQRLESLERAIGEHDRGEDGHHEHHSHHHEHGRDRNGCSACGGAMHRHHDRHDHAHHHHRDSHEHHHHGPHGEQWRHGHGEHRDHGHHERDEERFDEKRIVDLIVRLVSERVSEIVSTELERFARNRPPETPPPGPPPPPAVT